MWSCRLQPSDRAGARNLLRSAALAFATGAAALLAMEFVRMACSESRGDLLTQAAVHLVTYSALSYCYLNFVNLGHSSIRIRIYAEMAATADGLSRQDLEREYPETALSETRLQRLRESGDIVERNGRYVIGRRRLVPVARVIFGAKQLLLSKSSEFQ